MGRFLLILCTGALVLGGFSMSRIQKNIVQQDARLSTYEADVVARENAISALNQAVPFLTTRFDSLVDGETVSLAPLLGSNIDTAPGYAHTGVVSCVGRTLGTPIAAICNPLSGLATVRVATGRTLRLTTTTPQTLLPTKSLGNGSTYDASVRTTTDGKLEITATGTALTTDENGTVARRTHTARRTYARVSPIDAAVIAVAPYVNPAFSGGFQIDGRDTDPATLGRMGVGAQDRPGIKTNTQAIADRIAGVLTSSNKNRIVGKNGDGDIVYGSLEPNLDAIFEEAFLSPGRVSLPDSIGTVTYGSASWPEIVVRTGDLKIGGTVQGNGILIVNGNLQTVGSGKLIWDGIVMVRRTAPDLAPATVANADLVVDLGPATRITGSLVMFQRSSALIMPFDARTRLRYLGSPGAGLNSSVGIQHAVGGKVFDRQLVAPGANRAGDVYAPYTQDMRMGEQVNFYIGVYYPRVGYFGFADATKANTLAYKNFVRGHYDTIARKPFGIAKQTGPYQWWMAFEDMRRDVFMISGWGPGWDYNIPGREDQIVEVTLQCRQYDASGNRVVVLGVQQYEDCTPENPDTQSSETSVSWSGITATSGYVASPDAGATLRVSLNGAQIFHSSRSIARLIPRLASIRENMRLVMVDSWTSS